MQHQPGPHFRSIGAALRFYFRAREVLAASGGLRVPPSPALTRDFLSVGSAMRMLEPAERFILGELYGLTCFGEPHRTIARACKAARKRYPLMRWTPRMVSRMRLSTLAHLDSELVAQGLVARLTIGQTGHSPAPRSFADDARGRSPVSCRDGAS